MMDAPRLRQLIQDYGRLKRLEDQSPQVRGQEFNDLLADALNCWGIRAQASQRSRGEIDVQFALDPGHRFVLEAKWQQRPVGTGSVSKLQKRVRQRLAGTVGIVASMSGFTPEAIADVKDGERLEVLLIDAAHVEAMLSGFVPPQELLNRLLDHASFTGDCFTPLSRLMQADEDHEDIQFNDGPSVDQQVHTGLEARTVLRCLPFGGHGVQSPNPGHLWITTGQGLLDVDLREHAVSMAVSIPNLARNASVSEAGHPLVIRKAGAAIVHDDEIDIVAGGLSGNATTVVGTNGRWIFCNSYDEAATSGAVFVRHDGELGNQHHLEIDYPAAHGTNAGLAGDKLVVVGNAGVLQLSVDGDPHEPPVRFPGVNPMGMMWHQAGRWIIAAGEVDLYELKVGSSVAQKVATLNSLRGSVSELAADCDSPAGFLYSHPRDDDRGCVVKFTLTP